MQTGAPFFPSRSEVAIEALIARTKRRDLVATIIDYLGLDWHQLLGISQDGTHHSDASSWRCRHPCIRPFAAMGRPRNTFRPHAPLAQLLEEVFHYTRDTPERQTTDSCRLKRHGRRWARLEALSSAIFIVARPRGFRKHLAL